MAEEMIDYEPIGYTGARVTITLPSGPCLVMSGDFQAGAPELEGAEELAGNRTLTSSLWEFALAEFTVRRGRNKQKRHLDRKRSKKLKKETLSLANLVDKAELTDRSKIGWCSHCLSFGNHVFLQMPRGWTQVLLCGECGHPTVSCAVPKCDRLAVRSNRQIAAPSYCAEHRHEMPSFDDLDATIGELSDANELLRYRVKSAARIMKVTTIGALGVATVAPLAFTFAPLIAGVVGTKVSAAAGSALYGAAATNYGLAIFGFGSISVGGFGMAGGLAVLTAMGGLVGGTTGALLARAYVGQDKSFRIEKLKDGEGVPVVLANGFLTEGGNGWAEWEPLVTGRYPDSPVYRVHWGSKELKNIPVLVGGAIGKEALRQGLIRTGLSVSRQLTKLAGPIGLAATLSDAAQNPWHVAVSRAESTALILSDLISRTDQSEFVLIGHSLGGRVMARTAAILGASGSNKVSQVHLLGPAISAETDWHYLNKAVSDSVTCYFAPNDQVLSIAYKTVQAGQTALGNVGFGSGHDRLKNSKIKVSKSVNGHSEYFSKVKLR